MTKQSYFQCDDCGAVREVPARDIPTTGPPLCHNCKNPDEDGMGAITKREYDKVRKQQADMSATELLHVLAGGLNAEEHGGDARIAEATAENDNDSGELIVTLHNGVAFIISSTKIVVDEDEKIRQEPA